MRPSREGPGPISWLSLRAAVRKLIDAGADVIIPGEIPLNLLMASQGVSRVDDQLTMFGYRYVLAIEDPPICSQRCDP